ncbi:amino acid--[acyl-carrier-protein] ligase [Paraburkholderia sp. MMS20-SJTN17]|uniref:Amino acid--[acyl-carrier-protein] ligase n=1 Tax=Paraburkholderia translucens TaxID=2886945 RepID=A0ABS8KF11_9BURK|nr:amino acid--[acyl-carrier-protein] ligase [Paraburkholderia sp. MMS20-SJTN17]MCC8403285.1 amino acid--[acyl-carrier-protein] ligase [Paraburkholderia sp. MMS20-SJTN17]
MDESVAVKERPFSGFNTSDDRTGVNSLRDALVQAGLLIPTGVQGLFGRDERFERVVEAIDSLVTRLGADQNAEVLRFPPAMSRIEFERSEYLKGFPQLAGTVHSFCGGEHEQQRVLQCLDRGDDWTEYQKPTYVVMTPAACYPVYPVIAQRGSLPEQGNTVDVFSYCFRHEPSLDPTRMQLFRMREYVRFGTPAQIMAFRSEWIERGTRLAKLLELPNSIDLANDPFFGRGGKIAAHSQREQSLKFELLIPIESADKLTACLSFNYHVDHFGLLWGIKTHDLGVAHTGCVGFGLERLTLALFKHHGFDIARWPQTVRDVLWKRP